jgi:pilus assembly protein CpaE
VRDFIDVSAPAEEALRTTRGLLSNVGEPASRHGKVVALLGARAGMGVSTLAANLAVWLQKHALGPGAKDQHGGSTPAGRQTALVDLGLPAGDGALFLNTRCEFHFIDAVRTCAASTARS